MGHYLTDAGDFLVTDAGDRLTFDETVPPTTTVVLLGQACLSLLLAIGIAVCGTQGCL